MIKVEVQMLLLPEYLVCDRKKCGGLLHWFVWILAEDSSWEDKASHWAFSHWLNNYTRSELAAQVLPDYLHSLDSMGTGMDNHIHKDCLT